MTWLVGVLLLFLAAGPAAGATFALTDQDKELALREGRRSVTRDTFGEEWQVKNGVGDHVVVLTPFHRLALAARNAAFRNEPMKPDEPDKVLKAQGERLLFWTYLHGPTPDFARFYTPRLLIGDREVKPTFVQNERTPARQGDGRYVAKCVYGFPSEEVGGKAEVVLLVKDAEGRDVSRFTVDLGAMR